MLDCDSGVNAGVLCLLHYHSLSFNVIMQHLDLQCYDDVDSVDIKQTLFHYLFQHVFTFSTIGH